MIGLYVRTSSVGQNEDRQVENLTSLVGDQPYRLYTDKGVTGTIEFRERPQGQRLLRDVEEGWSLKFGFTKSLVVVVIRGTSSTPSTDSLTKESKSEFRKRGWSSWTRIEVV